MVAPRSHLMDQARHQFLAGPRLALDQYGQIRCCRAAKDVGEPGLQGQVALTIPKGKRGLSSPAPMFLPIKSGTVRRGPRRKGALRLDRFCESLALPNELPPQVCSLCTHEAFASFAVPTQSPKA